MRFWTGLLAGLLLAGQTVEHHYHVTETNRLRIVQTEAVQPVSVQPTSLSWQDVEGQEACAIRMLNTDHGRHDWDAADVLDLLDVAWADYDGPCDMEMAR